MPFFFTPYQAEQALSQVYEPISDDFSQTRHYAWKEFARLSQKTPHHAKILDLGCGNGRLLSYFEDKEIDYIGIDPCTGLLNHAKKLQPKGRFFTGGFLDIPKEIENGTIDEVWAIASFHHLSREKDRIEALQNIYALLKEGGSIVMTVWNLWDQKKYESHKKSAQRKTQWDPLWSTRDFLIPWDKQKVPRYYYSFEIEHLLYLFEYCGFKVDDIFYSQQKKNICIRVKKEKSSITHFSNLPLQNTKMEQVIEKIYDWKKQKEKSYIIFTPNPEMVIALQKDKEFKNALLSADLLLPDGNGLIWASSTRLLKNYGFCWRWIYAKYSLLRFFLVRKKWKSSFSEVLCGSDLFSTLLRDKKNTLYLIGGVSGAAKNVMKNHDNVKGCFDGIVNDKSFKIIKSQIEKIKPDIVAVGLGAPKQEKWIYNHINKINSQSIYLGIGGSIDFEGGMQIRAPEWMRKRGLEWVYRLFKQPERFSRIWTATMSFVAFTLQQPKSDHFPVDE